MHAHTLIFGIFPGINGKAEKNHSLLEAYYALELPKNDLVKMTKNGMQL
jgi:hypothetical protein